MQINDSFLTLAQRPLINKVVRALNPKVEDFTSFAVIHVRALGRHGFSGASLFLLWTDAESSQRFVVKVGPKTDIQAESRALTGVANHFDDAKVATINTKYVRDGELAAIIYPFISLSSSLGAYTTELEHFCFLDDREDQVRILSELVGRTAVEQLDGCTLLFTRVFEKCVPAHSKSVVESAKYGDHYKRSLKSRERIDSRLRQMYGIGINSKPSELIMLDVKVANPLVVLDELIEKSDQFLLGPIHGDLHATNVVLDNEGRPHLIDFAWAEKRGVIFKDYTLMECSLRYMIFPTHRDPQIHLKIDHACLEENGLEVLQSDTKFIDNISVDYRRLIALLIVVRSCAKAASSRMADKWFESYLKNLFVMHYRLHEYPGYGLLSARALGLLASRIR